ncbi:hypothetical protein BGW38_005778 [Lunasporangiospora selenospora]|uniref:Uncharacterized protein n=1 Tax=Lunasporangiospora selenospora TaxID=979761 RepID=A0A9P6FPH8_9FUNG|nr:hypothetical protein BGW38_005778 [Lunasporangiospora selenospora]
MCDQVKDFPIPCGRNLTMKDLIDATPRAKISKVMLEEKLFETWYSGRVVLIGDACHKSWISHFIRKVMNNLPKWIWYRVLDRMYEYRPQVSFLPRVVDQGEIPPLPASYSLVD